LEVSGWELESALREAYLVEKDEEWFMEDLEIGTMVFGARMES
jgi:hypothetical protein